GVGAVLYCAAYPQVQPYMGSMLGLKAFIAAVLGGIGVIPGAMLGAFIMGIAESMAKGFISSQLADAVVFGILIIVLLVKPSGILGKTTT
ncbi:MAG: branched-chain amino acid ABC transporter permease, partial [Clostridia bacterium]